MKLKCVFFKTKMKSDEFNILSIIIHNIFKNAEIVTLLTVPDI